MRIGAVLRAVALIVLAGLAMPAASAGAGASESTPGSFGGAHARAHVAASAPYRFENTILRLHFDVARGVVYGHETVVVRPKYAALRSLPFHSEGITYRSMLLDGRPVTFELDHEHALVVVRLPARVLPSTRLTVDFTYVAQPQTGLYFVRPDAAYPKITPQIWSQGEPQDNRRWFPTWDEPNEKTPSELVITVPSGWTAVANGYLRSHVRGGGLEIWDWREPRPKAPYLIAFVAGPLNKHHTVLGDIHDEGVARYGDERMDVDSFVPPQDAALNATCLGSTNRIVAYFQRLIGARFPWEKYDQMAAERYLFGGMEDTSATILTTRALHLPSEEVERPCDVLVAHELAQQWYGDDASWPDFSEVWLGEGFATYFDELWSERRFGERQFEYERYRAQQAYFAETRDYVRPIVDNVYADPIQMFDASSHQRPAQVLHTLRAMFGDARFFAALGSYYRQYRGRYASTHAFFTSIGSSFGANLDWFENEWFHRSDVPHYIVAQRYDANAKSLRLDIAQKGPAKPFRMPVTIEVFSRGRDIRTTSLIDRSAQTVLVPGVPAKPDMVLFDPNATILRRLTFAKPPQELAYQLSHAQHVGDREWALGELTKLGAARGIVRNIAGRAISDAALGDPFYGVRADAVGAAGTFADGATVEAALHDVDPRVRLAAAAAAASPGVATTAIVRDLSTMAANDDPDQAAAALEALGALKAPDTYELLTGALDRSSFEERIASGALLGLAAYGDARALPILQARTAYGTPESERDTAIGALGNLAIRTQSVRSVVPGLTKIAASDPLIASRIAAMNALGTLGDEAAVPALERIGRNDANSIARLTAEGAADSIKSAAALQAGGQHHAGMAR
jgi:aminopeptidase N